MSKLTIMKGLPASGKSTRAKELVAERGNTVRINKDLLRKMLHFGKFNGHNEGQTREAARTLASHFLTTGVNVIIDDTNLNPATLQSWKDLAKEHNAKIEYVEMDTPYYECLTRDAPRMESVGRSVIAGMALQWGLYPKPEKPVVVCDIDGTLANIDHRLHFLEGEKKDWKGFFSSIGDDTPRKEVQEILTKYLREGHQIFFVSARPDTYRNETVGWIDWVGFPSAEYEALFMRRAGDTRKDTEVKADIYNTFLKDLPIEVVIDDRPSVIRMWKEKGLNVLDVGKGVEF